MASALQAQLFPPSQSFLSGFTTSPYVNMSHISHVALTDSALGVTKVSSGTEHPVVPGPGTDEDAWEATYPEGSYSPSSGAVLGGFGFYLSGPSSFSSQLSDATEVLTSYSVRFEEDWEWQKGGKLPGQCDFLSVFHNACVDMFHRRGCWPAGICMFRWPRGR
jgi:Polysaccharide lyase 14